MIGQRSRVSLACTKMRRLLSHTMWCISDRENLVAHPEKLYSNLVYVGDEGMSKELLEKRRELKTTFDHYNNDQLQEILCWSCGWNVYNEILASYTSRLRIFHTRKNMGIWEVGSRWLIRNQPNDMSLGSDFMTQEFLRNQQPSLDIPLLKEMRLLSAPTDKVTITLMSRAQGVGLGQIFHKLSPEQILSYRNQLSNAIKQWRQFTSPVAKKVDGSRAEDWIIGHCIRQDAPTCTKVGRTNDEWFDDLKEDLYRGLSVKHKTKDPLIIQEKFEELKRNFPKSEPYVLTHGDLNLSNIIVKDNKIEAIIDWERAGYYSWWVERYQCVTTGYSQSDKFHWALGEEIGLEMDQATFQTEVIQKVFPVFQTWQEIKYSGVEHPNAQAR